MIIVLGIILLSIAAFFLSSYVFGKQAKPIPIIVPVEKIVIKEKVRSELPVRLKIPSINVDATFEYVGITSKDAMEVPKGPENVALFNLGPRPGEIGSAVVSGHYGWKNGISAVFDKLYTLRKGDKIYTEDAKGNVTTFVVRDIRTYGENDDATDIFSSTDDLSHLNLITCEGLWNSSKKSYADRLVVFADEVI